jgi:prevent-host-death family protein
MEAINVVEARRNFSDLMLRVAYGKQRIVIERHGKPMMALVSLEDLTRLLTQDRAAETTRMEAREALEEASRFRERLLAARGGQSLPGSAEIIAEMREERLDELANRG